MTPEDVAGDLALATPVVEESPVNRNAAELLRGEGVLVGRVLYVDIDCVLYQDTQGAVNTAWLSMEEETVRVSGTSVTRNVCKVSIVTPGFPALRPAGF